MARMDMMEAPLAGVTGIEASESYFQLGLMYAVGNNVPVDRVTAHKWFNIAAVKGNREAQLHRKELSEEMSRDEIAEAQRAAREWLQLH